MCIIGEAGLLRAAQEEGLSILEEEDEERVDCVLAGLDPSLGPIYTHGTVERVTKIYRDNGVTLPATVHAGKASSAKTMGSLWVE